MTEPKSRDRIETEGLIVGYAMSRLGRKYLESRGLPNFSAAFREAENQLHRPANSFKNLRDEFDPFFPNSRQGWHKRGAYGSRLKVLSDLADVSDDALIVIVVDRILAGDQASVGEAVDSIITIPRPVHNVAERLLTGRLAEEYFLEKCTRIVGEDRSNIIDLRNAAAGYDFGTSRDESIAYEVKGLKHPQGSILFTDREWITAACRAEHYVLIVVGNIDSAPVTKVFTNPRELLSAKCHYPQTVTASWAARVVIA